MVHSTLGAPIGGQITDRQMQEYTDLIYQVSGIRIPAQKTTLLSNRIRRRLRATGICNYDEYLRHLRRLRRDDAEWDAFLQEVTTHETYLFRDEVQWRWFRERYLPEVMEQARRGHRSQRLRIWSAAASTGDEAYTIACCVAAGLTNAAQWKVSILGTDIGVSALEEARQGIFGERAMRLVPEDLARRFFKPLPGEPRWQAKETLTSLVEFRQHNLLDVLKEEPFDLAFLKNVLIYFDKQSKQAVVAHVQRVLRDDGYLISGPAEGIADLLGSMERIESWLFRNRPNRT